MSRRGLYLAVGFLWGLLMAAVVGGAVSAVAAGAAWIWLFGDDSWPDWTNWAIAGSGIVAGLLTFLACMFIARIVANRQGGDEEEDEQGGNAFAWLLIVLALAGAGGYGWLQYDKSVEAEQAAARELASKQFQESLISETHKASNIAVNWPGGGLDGSVTITVEGARTAAYHLDWQLRNSSHPTAVMQGSEDLELMSGTRQIDIPLPADALVGGYRSLLERQDANILVDEPFLFETRLIPVLTDDEKGRLPPHAVQNLEQGTSSLIDAATTEFNVRFHLYGDITSWDG